MPTLSLKKNEGLAIGSDIRVTVSELRPGRVSLRVKLPDDMPVVRTDCHGVLRRPLEQIKMALLARDKIDPQASAR